MAKDHKPSNKKVSKGTGGKRGGKFRDKKLAHLGRESSATRVSEKEKRDKVRGRGATSKIKLKKAAFVTVSAKKEGKIESVKAKVLRVLESQNPEYVRQNIITKGAVVETDKGKVKVTNRVGQDGLINGVFVK